VKFGKPAPYGFQQLMHQSVIRGFVGCFQLLFQHRENARGIAHGCDVVMKLLVGHFPDFIPIQIRDKQQSVLMFELNGALFFRHGDLIHLPAHITYSGRYYYIL
jgi:hypothetical protein